MTLELLICAVALGVGAAAQSCKAGDTSAAVGSRPLCTASDTGAAGSCSRLSCRACCAVIWHGGWEAEHLRLLPCASARAVRLLHHCLLSGGKEMQSAEPVQLETWRDMRQLHTGGCMWLQCHKKCTVCTSSAKSLRPAGFENGEADTVDCKPRQRGPTLQQQLSDLQQSYKQMRAKWEPDGTSRSSSRRTSQT